MPTASSWVTSVLLHMAYSFANGTKASLDEAVSQDIGKNKIVLGAYADAQLSNKWTLSGRLDKEWGDNSHSIAAQMSFNYSF